VVHLHHPNPLGDVAALADARRPLVITQHSDVVRQRALWQLYGPVVRRAFARARFVVVASENYRQASRELAGFDAKVRVIPYGIVLRRFDLTPAAADRALALRAAWGGKPVVLAVGRLVGYKGFDVLLRAVAGLEVTTVIVGAGPEEPRLRALAPPGVVFAGRVADGELPAYYHACDVLCLPSLTIAEAFGVVLLEAMACGKPLVTTALKTGVTAVNRHGVTGLVVPTGDAGALREALRAVTGDAARRKAMGTAGRRAVEQEYTAGLMAERYLKLYRETLG
jgi:glycosyltransferase involved in cell wall biosynthesis